jgi:hypothetical protein
MLVPTSKYTWVKLKILPQSIYSEDIVLLIATSWCFSIRVPPIPAPPSPFLISYPSLEDYVIIQQDYCPGEVIRQFFI